MRQRQGVRLDSGGGNHRPEAAGAGQSLQAAEIMVSWSGGSGYAPAIWLLLLCAAARLLSAYCSGPILRYAAGEMVVVWRQRAECLEIGAAIARFRGCCCNRSRVGRLPQLGETLNCWNAPRAHMSLLSAWQGELGGVQSWQRRK